MDKQQIEKLEKLGIDCSQSSIDIFCNLLDLCVFFSEELEVREEDRMRHQIYLLSKNPTN